MECWVLQEFWNWDWDDLVFQDLPSMLRFVHAQTNQLIYFVGYSQASVMCEIQFVYNYLRNCSMWLY